MQVGLLGLQGAFRDHMAHLQRLGCGIRVVKDSAGLQAIDRLIIPGGESTVMAKFLSDFQMTAPLRKRILGGMPVWGICAGAILMAATVDGQAGVLRVLPIAVQRNAFGRHFASSEQKLRIPALGREAFSGVFIRAPRVLSVGPQVEVLAYSHADPVFVRCAHMMATTFHPELTNDAIFHEYFLHLG